jgi:hypothetical protein
MTQGAPENAMARIDAALARIDAAAKATRDGRTAIEQRHAALRTRVAEAIAGIDAIIAEDAD